jgi:hypothetical protein
MQGRIFYATDEYDNLSLLELKSTRRTLARKCLNHNWLSKPPVLLEWHTAETTVFLLRSRFSLFLPQLSLVISKIFTYYSKILLRRPETSSSLMKYVIEHKNDALSCIIVKVMFEQYATERVKSIVVWRTCGCSDILFQRSPPLVWNVTVINNVLPSRVKLP